MDTTKLQLYFRVHFLSSSSSFIVTMAIPLAKAELVARLILLRVYKSIWLGKMCNFFGKVRQTVAHRVRFSAPRCAMCAGVFSASLVTTLLKILGSFLIMSSYSLQIATQLLIGHDMWDPGRTCLSHFQMFDLLIFLTF